MTAATKTPRFSVRGKGDALTRAEAVDVQPTISTTVRWPDDLHRWITMKARDDRTSIQQMILGWARDAKRSRAARG